jgi:mRNA interferase MazF
MKNRPKRNEVWLADLEPVRGHEQGGKRPVLIVSVDQLNDGPADLVIACPITSKLKQVRSRVPIDPPEGGLVKNSHVICEAVRSVSTERLTNRLGTIKPATMKKVEFWLRMLLGFE